MEELNLLPNQPVPLQWEDTLPMFQEPPQMVEQHHTLLLNQLFHQQAHTELQVELMLHIHILTPHQELKQSPMSLNQHTTVDPLHILMSQHNTEDHLNTHKTQLLPQMEEPTLMLLEQPAMAEPNKSPMPLPEPHQETLLPMLMRPPQEELLNHTFKKLQQPAKEEL